MSMGRDTSHTDPALLQTTLLAGEKDLKGAKLGGNILEKKGKAFSAHHCNYRWHNHCLKENLLKQTPQVPCAGVSCVLTEGQERYFGWTLGGEMEEIAIPSTTHCVTLQRGICDHENNITTDFWRLKSI